MQIELLIPQTKVDVIIPGSPPIEVELAVEKPEVIVVNGGKGDKGDKGDQGPPGILPAQIEVMIAGESLSALRVVRGDSSGQAVYCSSGDLDIGTALGVTIESASIGASIGVLTSGILEDSNWSWDTGLPVYLSSNGFLSQVTPTIGYHQVIGTPESPTKLKISIQQPIKLA